MMAITVHLMETLHTVLYPRLYMCMYTLNVAVFLLSSWCQFYSIALKSCFKMKIIKPAIIDFFFYLLGEVEPSYEPNVDTSSPFKLIWLVTSCLLTQ